MAQFTDVPDDRGKFGQFGGQFGPHPPQLPDRGGRDTGHHYPCHQVTGNDDLGLRHLLAAGATMSREQTGFMVRAPPGLSA